MFWFLNQCVKRFGIFSGLTVYLHIKIFKTGKISIPGLNQPVYFRPKSSDVHTFREIFLREEYAIKLPDNVIPKIIIDAGANIGFTTLFFAKCYPTARIISLEPDQKNFELLKKNTLGYPNITPILAALWNKKGTIEIMDRGYGVRGFMVENSNSTNTVASMSSTTLAELILEYKIQTIDILKMDIEGSEKEVFSVDTEKWLPITKCLVIELHDRMKPGCSQAVFNALSHYNFECSIKGENLVFVKKD